MKKHVSTFVLLLLSLLSCSCSQFVDFASANFLPAPVPDHSIEITASGAVTGTNKIQRNGNVYILTGDIVGSIAIFCNGIVVNGAGYTLQGNGYRTGIWFQAITDVTIKNLHITNFTHGIELTYGMSMDGCTDITLSGNTITDNQHGITFWLFSGSNHVLNNIIANNTYGITLIHSPNNTFRNNQLTNNQYNFWITSETSNHMLAFINDIDASNTINGKPVIYWINEKDKTVPSDAGYVALVNCTDITVQNLVLTNNSQGILLVATNNSLITRNQITNNGDGIVLFAPYEQCSSNCITENLITSNTKDGIHSWNSENTIITGNSITNNQENGVLFYDSRRAVISENTITANKENGIKLWGYDSSDNTVSGNHIENNENGIALDTAFNNMITGNTIKSNRDWGIILSYNGFPPFSNNTIYHNNFFNDQQAVYTVDELLPPMPEMEPATDRWDNGSEGNYWSNYNGADSTGDGIGDTQYIINENNQDNHPLIEPVVIPPIIIPEFPVEENPTTPTIEPPTKPSSDDSNDQTGLDPTPLLVAVPVVLAVILGVAFYRKKKGIQRNSIKE